MAFKDILLALTTYPEPTPVSAVDEALPSRSQSERKSGERMGTLAFATSSWEEQPRV